MATRGVYFLSNDFVLELTIAFLNSLRKQHPDIPLCLIPYDENCKKILGHRDRYRFDVFKDSVKLSACDEISRQLFPRVEGAFRKLSAWDGPFEEFIYIDVDTILLDKVTFAFDYLDRYDYIASHSDLSKLKAFVWKTSIAASGILTKDQISFSANTGFFVSRKGFIRVQDIIADLPKLSMIQPHLEVLYKEQPLLNYLIVTSGKPYTSLLRMSISNSSTVGLEFWAGNKRPMWFSRKRNAWVSVGYPRIFLLHWAGQWQTRITDRIVYKLLRVFRILQPDDPIWTHRLFMPYKKLWKHYRYLHEID
ncbi:MAG: hypothetical protein JW902_12305 [Syntrophaceae bacterium]|nr:hypothetical protein [Syntrophaceae bacterium]